MKTVQIFQRSRLNDQFSSLRIDFELYECDVDKALEEAKPAIMILDQYFNELNELDGSNVIIYGSWARGTSVYGISDLNIAYELPQKTTERLTNLQFGGPIGIIIIVNNLLLRKFQNVTSNLAEGTIAAKFSVNLMVSLRPCLRFPEIGLTYANGQRGGTWRSFDPQLCVDPFQKLDPVVRDNLIRICWAARLWKKYFSAPISGILIDVLAFEFIQKSPYRAKSIRYFDCLLRDFFHFLANVDREQDIWRVKFSNETIRRIGHFEDYALQAYLISQQAIDCFAAKQERASISLWSRILGPDYNE